MVRILDETILKRVIQPRNSQSHKGDYGHLLLIGGTYPYGGAILMTARAAVFSGAGLVTVATDRENLSALHTHLPEAMGIDLADQELLEQQIEKADVILIGSGLALGEKEKDCFERVIKYSKKGQILVLDGGALHFLKQIDASQISARIVLTPHQKEWEVLSDLEIPKQTDTANHKALDVFPLGTILVQKSERTTIYEHGKEEFSRLTIGGPYQATGGMGDTLAGMIAGFLGQFSKKRIVERVEAAVYLHSAIAAKLSETVYVTLPTAISQEIPRWMKRYSR
ncbi:NAD(P)H-hydrate dehydratase [Streptococcus pneumoniae]